MKGIIGWLIVVQLLIAPNGIVAQEFCSIRNEAWQSGEKVTFHVYYTLAGIYIYGGAANFSIRIKVFVHLLCISVQRKQTCEYYDKDGR